MKLITVLLICFSMIAPAFAVDPIIDQQKRNCQANTSKEWDDATNRCVDKKDTTDNRAAMARCMNTEFNPTPASQKKCQDDLAAEAAKKNGVDIEKDKANAQSALNSITNDPAKQTADVLGAILAIINMLAAKKFADPCTCKNIFAITAIGGLLTEKTMKKDLGKKLAEVDAAYKLDAKTTTYDAHKKALQYLKDIEKAIVDIAAAEEKRLMLLSLGYGVAALMAIWETVGDPTCFQPAEKPAADTTTAASPNLAQSIVATKVGGFLTSPPGVIILAGIGYVLTDSLKEKAAEQKKNSENNIVTIDRIIKSFEDSWVDKCPNGRDSLETPECYCYKEDGTKNPSRTNSQTCINLWSGKNNKILASETNYNNTLGAQGAVGCVAVNGQFDTNCQCKKMVDAAGANACLKTTGTNLAGTNPLGMGYLTGAGFGHVTSNLDSAASGANNIRSLNSTTLANAIAKQKALNAQLFKQAMSDPEKKGFPDINNKESMLKMQNSLFPPAEMAKIAAAGGGSILSSVANNKPTGALAAAVKKVSASNNLDMSGGLGLNSKKTAKPADTGLNFNDNAASGAGAVTQNFAEKTYNYKENDIVKKPDVSIFEIISNRYIESGLKRLFDDK